MPFDSEFDDVFFVAMIHAANEVNAKCIRVDKEEFSGDIVQHMINLIRNSIAVIADLSGANPNVMYETGYSHAISKPTVHICSTPLSSLPFDVSHWNTLSYERGRIYLLQQPLASRLQSLL